MQFLLTAGLAHESSSRATNMVYTQMLFALALDKMVFGTTPGVLSIFGSSLILGSAIYVAVQRASTKNEGTVSSAVDAATPDEERGFMEGDQDGRESIHSDHPR
ncbi:MAG: hypothetical protein M1825_002776 [Sarcosagium campestre]|nr:MAG: hypothetical protein M1825_002776 [Sarcosagium campestre]